MSRTRETIDVTRLDMFTDEVFVFTPKGEVITLKRGSTPIDFAYRIHSRVGDTCVGAKVNGRIVPLDTELNTGDVVQIQTRKDGHPSRDWLLIAKTNNAKNRIRGWFKREMKDENIAKGKEMLEKEAKRQGFDLYKDLFISEWLEPIFKRYTFHEMDDLYAAVGCGGVSTNQILQRLIEECQERRKQTQGGAFGKGQTSSAQSQPECQDSFAWRNCKGPRKYVGSYGTLL